MYAYVTNVFFYCTNASFNKKTNKIKKVSCAKKVPCPLENKKNCMKITVGVGAEVRHENFIDRKRTTLLGVFFNIMWVSDKQWVWSLTNHCSLAF